MNDIQINFPDIPLTMFALYEAHDNKNYIYLLFTTILLMLFNFYLGYIIIIGCALALFVIKYIQKKDEIPFGSFFKQQLKLFLLDSIPVIIGIIISCLIVIPTLTYIFNYSSIERNTDSYYKPIHFYLLIVKSLFVFGDCENYSPIFSVLKDDYIQGQHSLFVGFFGTMCLIDFYIEAFKNKNKKFIYILIGILLFLIIPQFSWILNGAKIVYGRWYFSITLINLFLIGLTYQKKGLKLSIFESKKQKIVEETILN